jgi:hypothetical protein
VKRNEFWQRLGRPWDERSGNRSRASQIKFGLQGGIAVILEDQSQYQKKS